MTPDTRAGTVSGRAVYRFQNTSGQGWTVCFGVDPGYDLTASGDLTAFPDGSKVSSWAKEAMAWANGNQLINGFEDDTLRPGGDSTRAQAASILMNFDVNLAN